MNNSENVNGSLVVGYFHTYFFPIKKKNSKKNDNVFFQAHVEKIADL